MKPAPFSAIIAVGVLVLPDVIVGMTEAASRHWLAHDRTPDVDTLASQLSRLAWSGMRGLDG